MRWAFLSLLLLISASSQAQTIQPSFFGMNVARPFSWTSAPKVYISNQRLWGACNGGCATWDGIEICQPSNSANQNDPCYSWTVTDALVANALSTGASVVFTLGKVPSWAGTSTLPSNFQFVYDFMSTLATRYKGKIQFYELWNEQNLSSFWTGSIAQMNTLVQNVYPLIHAADANAIVLTPSTVNQGGFTTMDTFLANGGGAYADYMNIHGYQVTTFPTQPPEQTFQILSNYASMFSFYGQASKPFAVTEGYWLNAPVNTPNLQAAYTAVYELAMASSGVVWSDWWQYDGGGELSDGSTWLSPVGIVYKNVVAWLSGATFTSPIARVANTNQIRNPTFSGAIAGTQGACTSTTLGTLPTNMGLFNPDSSFGVFVSVVGTGTEGGVAYLDLRYCGTPTAGAGGGAYLYFEGGTQITASVNQQWSVCLYTKLAAGSASGVAPLLFFNEDNSSSQIGTPLIQGIDPFPYPLATQKQCWPGTNVDAGTLFVRPGLEMTYTVGVPFDITMRIGAPSIDNGSVWSGNITRANGATAQVIWDSNFGPTSFSTSFGHTWTLDGNQAAVSGSVTLTNLPQMLESAVQGGWTP